MVVELLMMAFQCRLEVQGLVVRLARESLLLLLVAA